MKKYIWIIICIICIWILWSTVSCSLYTNEKNIDCISNTIKFSENQLEIFNEIMLSDGFALLMEDSKLLYYKTTPHMDDNKLQTDIDYYIYDYSANEHIFLDTLHDVQISSGDYLYANNGEIYFSYQTGTDESILSLYVLNLKERNIRSVYTSVSKLPFLFISSLDHENIIIFEPDRISENEYSYKIMKFNTITEDMSILLETTYNQLTGEGLLIASVYAKYGNIYTINLKNGSEYFLCIYDSNGNMTKRILIQGLRENLVVNGNQYDVWRIYINSNTLYIKALNDKMYLYSLPNDTQNEIILLEELTGYEISPSLGQEGYTKQLFYQYGKKEILVYAENGNKIGNYHIDEYENNSRILKAFFANNDEWIILIIQDETLEINIVFSFIV